MGIRFHCPNGHKLNVKEFQGGKKGICPFCGAKIEIPTESTRRSSKSAKARSPVASQPEASHPVVSQPVVNQPAQATETQPAVAMPAATPTPEQPLPGAVPVTSQPLGPSSGPAPDMAIGPPVAGVPKSAAGLPATAVPTTAEARTAAEDPLSAADDVVWYVRPASGGQFGPAGADVMRSWIEDGRVSADSMVWREGWRDWRDASEVFVELGPGEHHVQNDAIDTDGASNATILRNSRTVARRRSKTTQTLVIVGLILAITILLGVLAVVLSRNSADAIDGSDAPPAPRFACGGPLHPATAQSPLAWNRP